MPVWIVVGVGGAVFVLAIAVAGSFNLFNGAMAPAPESGTRRGLPADFTVEDIDELGFSPSLRGYRADEVDAAIAALRDRIAELSTSPHAGPDNAVTEPSGSEAAATQAIGTEPTAAGPSDTEPRDIEPRETAPAETQPPHTEPTAASGTESASSPVPRTFG